MIQEERDAIENCEVHGDFFITLTLGVVALTAEETDLDEGDAEAQLLIGDLYYASGVHQDYVQAAIAYREAAEQRVGKAQYNLGIMYTHSQGVTQDNAQAELVPESGGAGPCRCTDPARG